MSQQQIIRHVSTNDRGALRERVTTYVLLDCIKQLGAANFSTGDLTDALLAAGHYRGVDYETLERAVRQSVVWLVIRGMAEKINDGAQKRITKAGNVSWPERYVMVRWNPVEKVKQESMKADFKTLNRVFLGC